MTYKIDTPVELYDRQYKEMQKVKKKLKEMKYEIDGVKSTKKVLVEKEKESE